MPGLQSWGASKMRLRWIAIILLIGLGSGVALERLWTTVLLGEDDQQRSSEPEVLYWVAPMDPSFRRDAPGKSPMGMDLAPVYADSQSEERPGAVRISPAVLSNLGVRTGEVVVGMLPRRIEAVGYVRYDEERLVQINTRVGGWIERLGVRSSGEPVRQGQMLYELYAPELVNAQREYLTALEIGGQTLVSASADRLAALGVGSGEIARLKRSRQVRQRLPTLAPMDGFVAELSVREGAHVTVHSQVMAVAQLDPVWVIVEVLERQAGWLAAGQKAEVQVVAFPGRSWLGTVDYVYPELDPETRTLRARLHFPNPDLLLRPNMLARVNIEAEATAEVVHIPREALIRGSIDLWPWGRASSARLQWRRELKWVSGWPFSPGCRQVPEWWFLDSF